MASTTPDMIARAFDPEGLDHIEEQLAQLRRVDLTAKFDRNHAAVLVALCHDHNRDPAVLFTLRSSELRSHRGEVSFPGGHVDPEDHDDVAAAIRECQEEIFLTPQRILGRWHDVTNKNATAAVTPCVAYLGHVDARNQAFNESEVAEVFTVPLATLMDPRFRSTWSTSRFPGVKMPQFDGAPHRIWGLTAYILSGVLNSAIFPTTQH
ncbi:uncharacterized protein MONBRDRAFT_5048 [Monosiga brevicollis MX1]|uniref:Nudix hydrolase domain-containing protein n=1 Tax=Monosiga brevicollis TaxID=81824 RepID=A9UPR6_MONBE|nr:uncharacterized protein MONBRDRAFT_5048 [Monosiga brevicollis MX1]EDQ92917.1 predicted protein [Monosiga brevicollis MX1]|eukprot:XP_001742679.1 hypothetical protein [Monosiga brevicollis MX1]